MNTKHISGIHSVVRDVNTVSAQLVNKLLDKFKTLLTFIKRQWVALTKALAFCAIITAVTIPTISNTQAGVLGETEKLWSKLGGKSVSTGASVYQGQKAGHVSLGSLYLGNQKKNRNLINVNFPEIDFNHPCFKSSVVNFGGLSIISGEELKNKMQSIIQQAGMMFVYLGISAISPTLSETLQEVFSKLQELGGFLSDECRVSEQMATWMKDKATEMSGLAKKKVVDHAISKDGEKSNLAEAYKQFPKGSGKALEEIAKKNPEKAIVDVNLAWESLKKIGGDNDIKQLMMTISGTIIIRANEKDKDGEPIVQYIASKIIDPKLLDGMLKGDRKIQRLTCDAYEKCLKPKDKEIAIKENEGFESKIQNHINQYKQALQDDAELNKESQGILAKSGLPIFMMYDVLMRHTQGKTEVEEGILVQTAAWNILYNYLTEMIQESENAANNYTMPVGEELKRYRDTLIKAKEALDRYELQDTSKYQLQVMLVNRAKAMEKALRTESQKQIEVLS